MRQHQRDHLGKLSLLALKGDGCCSGIKWQRRNSAALMTEAVQRLLAAGRDVLAEVP